jgi:arginine exporter protein ArgO
VELTWLSAVLAGVVAGLALAVPVGAVGVLVVQEALAGGRARGLAAAVGVAATDLLYAGAAVLAGAASSDAIGPHAEPVRWLAAGVLAVVAGRGLHRVWRSRGTGAWGPAGGRPARPGGAPGVALRFAALTVVNPATVVHFALVVSGLSRALGSGTDRVGFVVGVFLGSGSWHAALAVTAAAVGGRLSPSPSPASRTVTGLAGHGLVLLLALGLALRG